MNLQNVQVTSGKGISHVSCKKCHAGYTFPTPPNLEETLLRMGFSQDGSCPKCVAQRKQEYEKENQQRRQAEEHRQQEESKSFSNRLKKAVKILFGDES